MRIAVVGAGALGSVYGARLASLAKNVTVTFVVRPQRVNETAPIVIERADRDERLAIEHPTRSATVPDDADVIVLGVSATDLNEELTRLVGGPEAKAPVVVLTPLLPKERSLLANALGKRFLPAMPSVAGYKNAAGVVRYWLPRVATTLIEEPQPLVPAVDALARALTEAGIASRLQKHTYEINAATTVTFIPLAFALDVAGTVDALLDDTPLLKLATAAAEECATLGKQLGTPASWAELLVKFVGPRMLKIGVALARHRAAEAVRYVEQHFGRKMHEQNVAMAIEIEELARTHGLAHHALAELVERVRAIGSARVGAG